MEAAITTLRARGRTIECSARPLVMGIVNVNDDSFSGDGTLDMDAAWHLAARQVADGADIIDIGAESARTNRPPISIGEEIRRLLAFLEIWQARAARLAPRFADQLAPPLLSINTWRPEVAAAVLPIAGDLLNDLGALPDARNAEICARHRAALLIMHSVGQPKVPHTHVQYHGAGGVMGEVRRFFAEKIALATSAGLSREALVLDPGLDFAKQTGDNLRLIAQLGELGEFARPILLPISRKTFIGQVLDIAEPVERDAGTIAALVAGQRRGAHIFRVHHARAAAEAVRVVAACM